MKAISFQSILAANKMATPNNNTSNLFGASTSVGGKLYCEVIIPLALPTTYTWAVPEHLVKAIAIGVRVEVDLRNKKYAGIVKSISLQKPAAFEPKELLNVLDDEPLVYENQLKLWQWIGQYYMCSEGEVMQAAVPSNLKLSSESILCVCFRKNWEKKPALIFRPRCKSLFNTFDRTT